MDLNRDNEYSKTLSKLTIGGQFKRAEQFLSQKPNTETLEALLIQ